MIRGILRWAERVFLVIGSVTLGLCAAAYLAAGFYQTSATVPFRDLPERGKASPPEWTLVEPEVILSPPTRDGSPMSRIEIPRLGVSVIVVEGVKRRDLLLGAGHIPGTAFPGESGNIGIAGHRDTFFRKLGEVRDQDRITLTTTRAVFQYSVESTRIVEPTDLEVLRPTGEPALTLVTCYPFYFVGPAPKRFIVKARQDSIAALSPR